ncbi:hypothetical protein WICANDRAFT_65897 [Wickerhamomyces anomalus NRRL Y-366-8]|uniref:Uncharacterized protein n=1 Tax=Wickerhamomyces anomalus (strain ATCC 58044 / CBS 1984 / NCYC 433 / NRRL Y-366-8) TaxID=683960 RepID=A0A1E3NVM9_WICAA|nr:uncharacterized protein WICANDRAFT_65897 [Wickerhamomyces anomalus NRRL Y-366-8]ODQ56637.1 hypothetical protein WICANDRAFT_65897 [Wickerhamomyces anomalus NRRL Y-366-8]
MKTTGSQISSHVQGGIIMENKGGNTAYSVEIVENLITFGDIFGTMKDFEEI